MRATQCKNPECKASCKYTIHRDHWTEWLWFDVSYQARTMGVPIPKWYSTMKDIRQFPSSFQTCFTDTWTYYFIPLIPFIRIFDWLRIKWYRMAFWFRIHGMLDKEEGRSYQKFWPAYLHLPRKK